MPPSAIVLHAVRPRRQHDFASGVAIAPSTPPLESFVRSAPGQATSDVKLGVVSGPGSLFIALVETHCVWVSTSPKSSRACRTPRLTQTHQTFQFYCASKAARPLQTGHPFISPYERRNAREFSTAPPQGMLAKFLRSFHWSRVFGLYCSCRRRVVFLWCGVRRANLFSHTRPLRDDPSLPPNGRRFPRLCFKTFVHKHKALLFYS